MRAELDEHLPTVVVWIVAREDSRDTYINKQPSQAALYAPVVGRDDDQVGVADALTQTIRQDDAERLAGRLRSP